MEKKMGIGDFLNFGMENAKKHFLKFFGSILLSIVIIGILAGIGFGISSGFGALLVMIGSICVSIGFVQNIINLANGKNYDFKAFLPQPMVFLNFFVGMLITNIIIGIGFLLLIIPGMILGTMLNLVPFLILDEKLGPIEAIKESMKRTKGYKADIFWGFLVSEIVISLISVFVITLFFTVPMSYFIASYPYLRLTGKLDIPIKEEIKEITTPS